MGDVKASRSTSYHLSMIISRYVQGGKHTYNRLHGLRKLAHILALVLNLFVYASFRKQIVQRKERLVQVAHSTKIGAHN